VGCGGSALVECLACVALDPLGDIAQSMNLIRIPNISLLSNLSWTMTYLLSPLEDTAYALNGFPRRII
jgi:hypothetical protein